MQHRKTSIHGAGNLPNATLTTTRNVLPHTVTASHTPLAGDIILNSQCKVRVQQSKREGGGESNGVGVKQSTTTENLLQPFFSDRGKKFIIFLMR